MPEIMLNVSDPMWADLPTNAFGIGVRIEPKGATHMRPEHNTMMLQHVYDSHEDAVSFLTDGDARQRFIAHWENAGFTVTHVVIVPLKIDAEYRVI